MASRYWLGFRVEDIVGETVLDSPFHLRCFYPESGEREPYRIFGEYEDEYGDLFFVNCSSFDELPELIAPECLN